MEHLTFNILSWQWWLVIAILLFIFEIFSPGFVVACFGVGALIAIVPALIGLGIIWQVVFFCAGSILSLIYLRPFVNRISKRSSRRSETGMDALIGRKVKVSELITSDGQQGRVVVDGDSWRAVNVDGGSIEVGTMVEIVSYDSIILKVRLIDINN